MQISISHIAWPPERETEALTGLRQTGIRNLEVAPTRAFGAPHSATESSVAARAGWYREAGFHIRSFQALLFGMPDLELFGTVDSRQRMKDALIAIGRLAGWAGAGPMVFGSPGNRLKRDLSHADAMRVATGFFREIADACADAGSCLVIEAIPEAYGADFCTNLEQAAGLVEAVDSPGLGLHVDAGGIALGGENFEPVLRQSSRLVRHVHASQPHLASFAEPDPVHSKVARVLREIDYNGGIAIEMRAQPDGMQAVAQAIDVVGKIYGKPGNPEAGS